MCAVDLESRRVGDREERSRCAPKAMRALTTATAGSASPQSVCPEEALQRIPARLLRSDTLQETHELRVGAPGRFVLLQLDVPQSSGFGHCHQSALQGDVAAEWLQLMEIRTESESGLRSSTAKNQALAVNSQVDATRSEPLG